MKCEICKLEINKCGFGSHLKRTHKIESKDYYDTYIGKPNICICGKETKFINIFKGYRQYCCQNCARKDILEKTKQKYNVSNISQVEEIKSKMKQNIKNNWNSLTEQEYQKRCKSISNGTIEGMKDYVVNYEKDINKYCKIYVIIGI